MNKYYINLGKLPILCSIPDLSNDLTWVHHIKNIASKIALRCFQILLMFGSKHV